MSWRGLGEVKRGKEGKERVGKKLIEGRRREVEVTRMNDLTFGEMERYRGAGATKKNTSKFDVWRMWMNV